RWSRLRIVIAGVVIMIYLQKVVIDQNERSPSSFFKSKIRCGMTDLEWIGYLTYGYGFVCAALYNAFIAYGVSFVKQASSKNVSYILISGSAGAMFSPAISAFVERIIGLQTVMYAIPLLYAAVLVLLLISSQMKSVHRPQAVAVN
ncbi:MAG: hypothetical protein ACRC5E_17680, partial [Shewanella sp.]